MLDRCKHFFMIGIAGSGMAPIAEVLLRDGYQVSGADLAIDNLNCQNLIAHGAKIYSGHDADNLQEDVDCLVYSSAISADNPEYQAALTRGIPVFQRACALAAIMKKKRSIAVAGSHGKTSTSSMLAVLLAEAGRDPTAIIGGMVHQFSSNARIGNGELLVAEADESDASFLELSPEITIVTNLDDEHLSAYQNLEHLEKSFFDFTNSVPTRGVSILCTDDPKLARFFNQLTVPKLSYGKNEAADWRAECLSIDSSGTKFKAYYQGELFGELAIQLVGEHYMLNALGVVAAAHFLSLDFQQIKQGLLAFNGVARRMEVLGQLSSGATVISDYAHHPTEIAVTLEAIKSAYKKKDNQIKVVFQPHRYSRTRESWADFLKCFAACDQLVVSDIYPAGEKALPGITSENLVNEIEGFSANYAGSLEDSYQVLANQIKSDDLLVFLGAGSIGAFANNVVSRV